MICLDNARRSKKWTLLGIECLEERVLLSNAPPGGGPYADPAGPGATTTLYVRKDQSTLTQAEKDAFVNAVKQLKNTFIDGSKISVYDQFVQEHYDAFAAGQAHGGPAFLAWHREFLLQFEQALQTVDPTVTIPYWDFTVDNSPSSSLWDKKFLGGNGDPNDSNIVKSGPFRQGQWTLLYGGPDLQRNFGVSATSLPTADDVQAAFQATYYDVFPYDRGSPVDQSFRNNVEGFNHPSGDAELHNRVHNWIGGSMLSINSSPEDPVFWLLHANIDRLWAQWQAANPTDGYDPESGAATGHNLRDPMTPFGVTPESVLDHYALGYRYDTEPADGGSGSGGSSGPALAAPRARGSAPVFAHGAHGAAPGSGSFAASLAPVFLHGVHEAVTDLGSNGFFAASLTELVGMSMEHGSRSFSDMGDGRGMEFARSVMAELASGGMGSAGGGAMTPMHICT
jgi:hypothetical protein